MVECPYKGLLPYTDEDSPYFFGRERERRIIAENLRACRITVLYGASGVGKSSVLWAGVVHDLRNDPDYSVVLVRDWRDPIFNLQVALGQQQLGENLFLDRSSALSSEHFKQALRAYLSSAGRTLLIMLDQFEEYFQYHPAEKGPNTFAELFPQLIKNDDLNIHFLISIREDSLASLDRFRREIPDLFENRLSIDFLSFRAAREAILKPLEKFNKEKNHAAMTMDRDLADRVVEMIAESQGADRHRIQTPYLQLVLTRWWEREIELGSSIMQEETLTKMGGVKTIVNEYLESTIETLTLKEQKAVASVFAFMVTASGRKIAWTISDLTESTRLEKEELLTALEKLRTSRVVTNVAPPIGSAPNERCYEFTHDVVAKAALDWRKQFQQAQDLSETRAKATRFRRLSWVLGFLLSVAVVAVLVAFHQKRIVDAQKKINDFQQKLNSFLELLGDSQASFYEPELSLRKAIAAYEAAERLPASMVPETEPHLRAEQRLHDALLNSHYRYLLSGHIARVRSVAWSPDGKWLATASDDSQVKVWNASTWKEAVSLDHGAQVMSIAWSPDGTRLASAGWDKKAVIWDPFSKGDKRKLVLSGNTEKIWSVAWSRDGQLIATASADEHQPPEEQPKHGAVKIWNANTGKLIRTIGNRGERFWSVAWDPTNETRIVIGSDRWAWVWDARRGRQLLTLYHQNEISHKNENTHNDWVYSVTWSPDGTRIATGSADYKARIWDAKTGTELVSLRGHGLQVYSVAWSPDGEQLITGSGDHTARIWDAKTGGELLRLHENAEKIFSAAWSPDKKYVATGIGNSHTKIWATQPTELFRLQGHTDEIWGLSWKKDGRLLATASFDGTVRIWDPSTGTQQKPDPDPHPSDLLYCVSWSPNGMKLAAGTVRKHIIQVLDAQTGEIVLKLEGHGDKITSVDWHPSGGKLATGSLDETIRIWDMARGKQTNLLRIQSNSSLKGVWSVAWSPDGKLLAAGVRDHTARLWDEKGNELRKFIGHAGPVTSVAWSPDGKWLATASTDQTVKIWDSNSAKEVKSLQHVDTVRSVAWNIDGVHLATASEDGRVRIWDASTGKELYSIRGHDDFATAIVWSPDGTKIASASQDKTVQLYIIDGKKLLELAKSRIQGLKLD